MKHEKQPGNKFKDLNTSVVCYKTEPVTLFNICSPLCRTI